MERGTAGVSKIKLLAPVLLLALWVALSHSFSEKIFHSISPLVGPDGSIDSVLFCPQDGRFVETILLELIRECRAVYGALFLLNRKPIIDELIKAHMRGAIVEIVVDQGALNSGSNHIYEFLRAGVSLYVYDPKKFRPLMHNKFLIFKGVIGGRNLVASGSMNITYSGLFQNQDNVTFRDKQELVVQYKQQFERLKNECSKLDLKRKEH